MPPRTVVQLVNTLQSVFDLIETLHAMTAFDTSDSEMGEGFFTFDILIYFFIFVSMITTWIWLATTHSLSTPLSCAHTRISHRQIQIQKVLF
jgi:hypothetical protein